MAKVKIKDDQLLIKLTSYQKKQIKSLAELSHQCMSEFILDTALKPRSIDDSFRELTIVLSKHFREEKAFQRQQQITMYMLMQLSLYLASFSKDREEIMEFYDEIYQGAIEKFGKEGE